jgi:hypothetical protein
MNAPRCEAKEESQAKFWAKIVGSAEEICDDRREPGASG